MGCALVRRVPRHAMTSPPPPALARDALSQARRGVPAQSCSFALGSGCFSSVALHLVSRRRCYFEFSARARIWPEQVSHLLGGRTPGGARQPVRRQPARAGCAGAQPGNQPRTRRRNLIKLGANPEEVKLATRSRKGYWRMSSNRIVQQAMNNQWLEEQGVPDMRTSWIKRHYGPQARV